MAAAEIPAAVARETAEMGVPAAKQAAAERRAAAVQEAEELMAAAEMEREAVERRTAQAEAERIGEVVLQNEAEGRSSW